MTNKHSFKSAMAPFDSFYGIVLNAEGMYFVVYFIALYSTKAVFSALRSFRLILSAGNNATGYLAG